MRARGLLTPEAADNWPKMEYSYYVLSGNGVDSSLVMSSINRARRRFFLRPSYVVNHAADLARIVATKQSVALQTVKRLFFGGGAANGAYQDSVASGFSGIKEPGPSSEAAPQTIEAPPR